MTLKTYLLNNLVLSKTNPSPKTVLQSAYVLSQLIALKMKVYV